MSGSRHDPGLVVAVDIGTTGVKAAAVDVAAVTHADAEREYPTESPRPGWAVQDPGVVVEVEALHAWRDPVPADHSEEGGEGMG